MLGTDTAFGKITIPPLRLPLPCQLGIVTEILLPRYIFFFFFNLFSVSSSMLFSVVGGHNLPLCQFSTALRVGIATASPFVSMFPCHPALWLMEKPGHSILSPHLSISSFSCLCRDWTQTSVSYAFLCTGGHWELPRLVFPFVILFFSSPSWQQG